MEKLFPKSNSKFRSFSPRGRGFSKTLQLNNIYNIGNINDYYTISKFGSNNNSSNIFLYYSPKNINIKNAKIRNIYSPQRSRINLRKSSSQNNIYANRPLSHNNNQKFEKYLYSFNYNRNKSPSFRKKKLEYNLEKEKLYQETYQIRKIVNILNKKLSKIKMENLKKDNQLNRRQKKINDIIISNNNDSALIENNNIKKPNNDNYTPNINDNSSYLSMISESLNSPNNNILYNDVPIYANFNFPANKKSATYNLLKKIKRAINEVNNEIELEKNKYEKLKHSLFLTKLNEFDIEANLLEEQINKIMSFINRDLVVQEDYLKKKQNFENLQINIEKQEKLIKSLNERNISLDKEEEQLKENLKEIKKNLENKSKKINIAKEKLNLLIKKNNNLAENKKKEIKKVKTGNDFYKNLKLSSNNPELIKAYYTSEISKINKIIKFYVSQNDFNEKEIARLKDQEIKTLGNNKNTSIGIKMDKNSNFGMNNYFDNINAENLSENEKMEKMKNELKELNKEKQKLKKKLELYENKLNQLESNNQEDDFYNKSQIEFGIDEKNPFCANNNDNENVPEKTEKFTSAQFNQFTYILFKNFESKGISFDESKEKLFKLFSEFNQKNKITKESKIKYPSDEFNTIVEGYSKIILDILERNNNYNYLMTKIFIKALFYNSFCDVNKLIEYFKVLFSYTKNYYLEEDKYLNKLRTKYKNLVEKLIKCIKDYLVKEKLKNVKYIDLLKVKMILEQNEIKFKDKYIEFIFYYMKKFENPEAKLNELKYNLLNNIFEIEKYDDFENKENSEMNYNANEENNFINDINIDINKNENKNPIKESKTRNIEDKTNNGDINNNNNNKEGDNKEDIKDKKKDQEQDKENKKDNNLLNEIELFNKELLTPEQKNIKKSNTEENFTPRNIPPEFDNHNNNRMKKNNNANIDKDKDNSDEMEEEEDSMTEITNEEYVKQLLGAIEEMSKGLSKANENFDNLMNNVIQKRKINGKFYEYVSIEDFNEQLKTINISLTDLKLSCLCSKYCIPNELRLIDKDKIERDIKKYKEGNLKLEEEDNI